MKVLEPGNTKEKWVKQLRCTGWGNGSSGCNALLEVDYDDLRYFPGVPGDSWGSRDPAISFKCPCCGRLTDLGLNDWPKDHRRMQKWTKEWQEAEPDTIDFSDKIV